MEDIPTSDVSIVVNGEQKAVTDDRGRYFITFDKPGMYTIEAVSKQNIYDVIKIDVSEKTRKIPTLKAIAVRLCGQMLVFNESGEQDPDYLLGYAPAENRKLFCQ